MLAEHADYKQRFEVAAQRFKQEARGVTNVEIAQSQAQMNANYSSAMLQAQQETQNPRFSTSASATCLNSRTTRIRRGTAIDCSTSRTQC